jgi:beta-galactosidase
MKVRFPADFLWGTAISAFQTEMGVSRAAIDKGTDWYQWTHSPEIVSQHLVTQDLPEEGAGFWDTYREDMKRAVELGTNSFRMAVEWSRIFPESTGTAEAKIVRNRSGDVVDVPVDDGCYAALSRLADWDAVEHYTEMLAYAKSLGLKVLLTLCHFTLPFWAHDPLACHHDFDTASKRGWADGETVVEFAKYADFAARVFAKNVDLWETINEPDIISSEGYLQGKASGFPPALADPPLLFRVQRNLAFAHNVACGNLKKHAPNKPVGIAVAPNVHVPVDDDPRSKKAAEYATYMNVEWILNGIVYGTFDNNFDMVAEERAEGVRGSDYIGVDYYNRIRMRYSEKPAPPGIPSIETLPCIDCTDSGWDIFPEGIRWACRWIFEKYRLPIYILENGISDAKDEKRARYIRDHLKALGDAITIDEIPIRGYYHWALIDNFEWSAGYSKCFGLFAVDYRTKARTRRKSADVFEGVCRTGELEY